MGHNESRQEQMFLSNMLCQDLIRPIKKTGMIQDFIKACIDASPAIVQRMTYAAVMRGGMYSATVRKTYEGGRRSSVSTCFECGNQDIYKEPPREGRN